MVIVVGNEIGEILNEAVCVSFRVNVLEKGMNPSHPQLVEQTGFFNQSVQKKNSFEF